MKCIYCVLFSLFVLFVSCNKNDDDNKDNDPPVTTREWFKLNTIIQNTVRNGNFSSNDSTSIIIDSTNNKIVLKGYTPTIYKDTSVETFTYNSNYQLVLYEHADTYDQFFITRMQFVRDADGRLTKVLSEYKDGLMASSEGICKYDKRGDTTLITFIDSARKHRYGYSDAQDYYQVALLNNNRIAYYKRYSMGTPGKLDSSLEKFEYDATGNLITETDYDYKTTPVVYSYQRGSETPKELQKFIEQWVGDLVWFRRSKLVNYLSEIGYSNAIVGNALQSIKKDNVAYQSFTNGFDMNGNLNSITYQTTAGGSIPATHIVTQKFKYRP